MRISGLQSQPFAMACASVLFGLSELGPPAAVPTTTAPATATALVAMMAMIRFMVLLSFRLCFLDGLDPLRAPGWLGDPGSVRRPVLLSLKSLPGLSTFVLPPVAPDRLGCHHRCCVNVCARTPERPLQRGESLTRLNLSVLPVLLQV